MVDSSAEWVSVSIAVLALVASTWANLVSRAARRDVQVFKDAAWVVEPNPEWPRNDMMFLSLRNVGETRATDVIVRWDFDPLNVHESHWEFPAIERESSVDATIRVSHTESDPTIEGYAYQELLRDPARRFGTITWTDRLGRRKSARIQLPAMSEVLRALHRWRQNNPVVDEPIER